jgi:hypothetical protein
MGLGKSISSIILGTGIFLTGYSMHGCTHEDQRYEVRRNEDISYLFDKKLSKGIQIVNKDGYMNLGSTLYRFITLMNEDDLVDAIDKYREGYHYIMWKRGKE